MNADELRALGLAMYGREWQSPLARALGVNARTVRKWASGEAPIGARVQIEIRRALGADDRPDLAWPRDEWIVQREEGRRCYVVHARRPRFIARAVECDDDGLALDAELPADILAGVVYATGDMVLAEIVWIDPAPGPQALAALMEAAADAARS